MSESSAKLLESVLKLAAAIDRPAARCQAYLQMAEAFLTVGLQPGAIELLGAAEKAAASFKRPEEKAVVLARAAKIYFDADDTLKASDLFTRATLLSRAAETPEQRAGALYQVASDLADAGLNDRASQLLSELHDLAVVPENNLDAVGELIGIAGIYTDIGQPAQAHKILAGALNLTSSIKDSFFKARRLLEIAREYLYSDSRSDAESVLNDLLPLADRVEAANRIFFSLGIVDLLIESKNGTRALEILTTSLGIARSIDVPETRVNDVLDIAEKYYSLGEAGTAAELLSEAEAGLATIENSVEKVSSLIRIATQTGALGAIESAFELAQRAHTLCLGLGDKRSLVHLLGSLALLYVRLDHRPQAADSVSEILNVIQEGSEKTAGLGPIASDLAEAGEIELAARLCGVVREPEVKLAALAGILTCLAASGKLLDDAALALLQST